MEHKPSPLPYLIAISFMWGSAYMFLKVSSAEVPPLLMAALRAGVAVPALLLLCVAMRQFTIDGSALRDMVVIGTLNGWLPNSLAAFAITSMSSAEAGILQATTPLITGLLAAALLQNEILSIRTIFCLIGGFLGVVLVIASSPGAEATGTLLGYALMLGVAFSFGAGAVYARWAKPKDAALIAAGQLVVAALVALLASFLVGERWPLSWSGEVLFSVMMLGVFCTALPAVLFLVVIARHKAVKVGAASFLQPVWAILLGALFLAETISGVQLLGAAVIAVSVVAITTRIGAKPKASVPKHHG